MEGGRILPLLGIPAEKERQDGEGCQIRKKKKITGPSVKFNFR